MSRSTVQIPVSADFFAVREGIAAMQAATADPKATAALTLAAMALTVAACIGPGYRAERLCVLLGNGRVWRVATAAAVG